MEYLQYLKEEIKEMKESVKVLNLIINGIPSILHLGVGITQKDNVLNLIINGIPSILLKMIECSSRLNGVLNLIINGIPSILRSSISTTSPTAVLNLIINGIPSIRKL